MGGFHRRQNPFTMRISDWLVHPAVPVFSKKLGVSSLRGTTTTNTVPHSRVNVQGYMYLNDERASSRSARLNAASAHHFCVDVIFVHLHYTSQIAKKEKKNGRILCFNPVGTHTRASPCHHMTVSTSLCPSQRVILLHSPSPPPR
jgi:hypothetical protein